MTVETVGGVHGQRAAGCEARGSPQAWHVGILRTPGPLLNASKTWPFQAWEAPEVL